MTELDESERCVSCKALKDEITYLRATLAEERRLTAKITLRSLRANGVGRPNKPNPPLVPAKPRYDRNALRARLEERQRKIHVPAEIPINPVPEDEIESLIEKYEHETADASSLHPSNGNMGS